MTICYSHRARTATLTLLAGALLLGLASTTFAAGSILCWPASGSPNYDQDGDGYADFFAPKNARVELQPGIDFEEAEALTCPEGYVMKRGDTNDSDPAVHPRQYEVGSNDIDDNGDGRIDEPIVIHTRGDGETSMSIRFRINNALALWYATNPEWRLMAKVQYQKLVDTGVTLASGLLFITDRSFHGSYAIGLVRLTGLEDGTVYRARVQLYARRVTSLGDGKAVGEQSAWCYAMTGSLEAKTQERSEIVFLALDDAHRSDVGEYGYLGSWATDGTMFDAEAGQGWSPHHYSYVTRRRVSPSLPDAFAGDDSGALVEYFDARSVWAEIPETMPALVGFAKPADYLGIGADADHLTRSALFLAYEPGREIVWTVEGNATGSSDIGGTYASRYGANEIRVVERPSSSVAGFGMIESVIDLTPLPLR